MEKKAIIRRNVFSKTNIKQISFLDGNSDEDIPSYTFDLSVNEDRSVIGWKDYEYNTIFVAPACGNKIIANKDCSHMFDYCEDLENINGLHNLDTSNVLNMSYMFNGCRSLTSLDLSSFVTSNVTNMQGMFSNCESLHKLNLSFFDTSNVTDMSHIFECCYNLNNLNISSFDTRNVEEMDWMFYQCKSIVSLDLSNFDTSKVSSMIAMFYSCENLKELNISSFNTKKVENMF